MNKILIGLLISAIIICVIIIGLVLFFTNIKINIYNPLRNNNRKTTTTKIHRTINIQSNTIPATPINTPSQNNKQFIGGCKGTRYGCCSDGITPKGGLNFLC